MTFCLKFHPHPQPLEQGYSTQILWRALPSGQNDMFLPIHKMQLSRKQAKSTKFWAYWAKFKTYAGLIWPAGRMLCMPALECHVSFEWPLTPPPHLSLKPDDLICRKFYLKILRNLVFFPTNIKWLISYKDVITITE